MQEDRKRQKSIAAFTILFAIALIAVGEILYTHRKTTNESTMTAAVVSEPTATTPTQTTPTPSSSSSTTPTPTTSQSSFKDGTYKATGSYNSPAGEESITISVTLKDGVISDTSAQGGANDLTAKEYQSDFIQNYKTQVVGKNIANVQLSRVSGSSLTPQGFNNALAKIENQAKA